MRSLITDAFKEKQTTTEVHVVNRLVVHGRMELEETLMMWKGNSHVQGWFDAQLAKRALVEKPKRSEFLDAFFENKV